MVNATTTRTIRNRAIFPSTITMITQTTKSFALSLLFACFDVMAETNSPPADYQSPPSDAPIEYQAEQHESAAIRYHAGKETERIFHLTAGVRFTKFELDAPVKGEPFDNSFIGSINRLQEVQDTSDPNLYFQATCHFDWLAVGAGITWDELRIKTLDQNTGDGDVIMDAQIIYVMASIPNETRFTPYMEIGRGKYDNSFDPLPAWSQGGLRRFDLANSTGSHLAFGLDIEIGKGWCANLYMRQSDVDVDGIYVYNGDAREPEPFTFTTKHTAYGVGLSYTY